MRVATMFVVVILSSVLSAEAQKPVGSMERLSATVKSGDTVYVTDSSGLETKGTFINLADATLTMLVEGELRRLPASDLRQVARRGDSLRNGILIGVAVGVGAAVASPSNPCDPPDAQGFPTEFYCGGSKDAAAVAFGAAFGVIGGWIDRHFKGRTVVFRAGPAPTVRILPVVLPHQQGIRLSVAFD